MAEQIDTQTAETTPPVEESGSLADHERSYSPDVEREAEPAAAEPEPVAAETEPAVDRNDKGQFKPRQRAKSQQASPEDVPRIAELTRKLREAERERDELRTRTAPPPAQAPAAEPEPKPTPRAAGPKFPTYDEFTSAKGYEDATWDDYYDARARWNYAQVRAQERAQEAEVKARETFDTHVSAYRDALPAVYEQYPDFDEVTAPNGQPIPVSKALERAVIEAGPATAYYLATHPEEREALTQETLIDPANPAFAAVVATTRRYLSSLVASPQRSSSSRAVAASTGSALALVRHTAPKPPNPVRTSGQRDPDTPPGEDASLAEHERAYGPKRQRA